MREEVYEPRSNRSQEEQPRVLTGKVGWVVGGLGIPLAAILTWVFSAGQLSYITNQNATHITDLDTRVRAVESAQIKTDAQYANIIDQLSELKNEVRKK